MLLDWDSDMKGFQSCAYLESFSHRDYIGIRVEPGDVLRNSTADVCASTRLMIQPTGPSPICAFHAWGEPRGGSIGAGTTGTHDNSCAATAVQLDLP